MRLWPVQGVRKVQGLAYEGYLERVAGRINLVAMAIVVDVTLISGRRVSLEADLTASVESLAERARRAFGVGHGRLVSSCGSVLGGDTKLGEATLQGGDSLTLQVGAVRIGGGACSFAAILADASVVMRGATRPMQAAPCNTS